MIKVLGQIPYKKYKKAVINVILFWSMIRLI